ncbi:MAG: hypothetical protein MUF18_11610 [Fimbriiglobus sp.]|nr:hypothetical protein [Fimbriiglobus sp.]
MERSAYVPVVGVLRLKVHPPAWVNGQCVAVWTEIWIEGIFKREEKE